MMRSLMIASLLLIIPLESFAFGTINRLPPCCRVELSVKNLRHQRPFSCSPIPGGRQILFIANSNDILEGHTSINNKNVNKEDECSNAFTNDVNENNKLISRQDFFTTSFITLTAATTTLLIPEEASAKCTDIEACREIGEKKVEQDMIDNPAVRLKSGARYKVLQPGISTTNNDNDLSNTVQSDSNVDLIFSVSTLSGGYMYSRGFGFEKIDIGDGKLQSDLGLDSLRVRLGQRDVPLGIEDALVGMKKGERRRVELPPNVGFVTSEWKPEPTSKRGKARIVGYRQILEGNGSTRPPFPAATIWDVEVLRIRK